MLVNICVDSTLKLKSKITDTNTDLSFAYFLRMTEMLVSSGSYSDGSNFDLECLEQATVSELNESLKG